MEFQQMSLELLFEGEKMENNQIKDNVFCIDCHGWQEQIYRGNFKDGSHTYKRYICCQCGTENDVEDEENTIEIIDL